ncbi:hypothetical protein RRG08_048282 [Elysia crispata]|uniref:Protein kinase domain-containing protein n=1 Tax=Elysia crispata TaxID=231223 RepID=A0AAE0ZTF0_9GAST|nr:hypothetical protein RRG08_048282 [Elysia crispata]
MVPIRFYKDSKEGSGVPVDPSSISPDNTIPSVHQQGVEISSAGACHRPGVTSVIGSCHFSLQPRERLWSQNTTLGIESWAMTWDQHEKENRKDLITLRVTTVSDPFQGSLMSKLSGNLCAHALSDPCPETEEDNFKQLTRLWYGSSPWFSCHTSQRVTPLGSRESKLISGWLILNTIAQFHWSVKILDFEGLKIGLEGWNNTAPLRLHQQMNAISKCQRVTLTAFISLSISDKKIKKALVYFKSAGSKWIVKNAFVEISILLSDKCLPSSTMPIGLKPSRSSDPDRESKDLCILLELINAPASKQQLPPLKYVVSKKSPTAESVSSLSALPSGAQQSYNLQQSAEAAQLEKFSLKYKDERQFSNHKHHKYFLDICIALIKNRLNSQEWLCWAPAENVLRVLMCLRILLRDSNYQKTFFSMDGTKALTEYFQKVTDEYLYSTDGPFSVDILKEMTNIFQKMSASVDRCEWLVRWDAHKPLVRLLTATDVFVLHCSLYALIGLAQSDKPRQNISELNVVEMLLRIIQEYDSISKKLAANLLRLLLADSQSREHVKLEDGVPILLSQLISDNVSLLWHVVWCLVQLCGDADCRDDIRQMGGIPLILSLLHDRKFVSERTEASDSAVASAGVHRKPVSNEEHEEFFEHQYSLRKACCAALAELVLNDTNAQQIVQANGVYSLGLLILPQDLASEKEKKRAVKLQQNAFRALRFLFSMERNRRLFKQLFPSDLFEMFIDVGHYNRELSAYKHLADKINSLPKEAVNEIAENISNTNQNKEPNSYKGEYAVFELLGSGAFGSVYKVKKKTGRQSFLALKEVNLQNTVFGKSNTEKAMSVGEITNELKIMKEEMRHPNIVRYYKTFELDDKLYIVMEFIEGAHLGEHFNSLREKKEKFQESRIWDILLQLILALRYLHKEKGIVHRDLTPSNIMLGENDKVTITDFGLAKQKRSDCSKMTSVVGTILYSCPEVVQNHSYGEKADIWALGCILYQMCVLQPPFNSTNMLTLVNKIVAGDYIPIQQGEYSTRLLQTIKSCLSVQPDDRPDILDLSGQLSNILLTKIDDLRISRTALEKKLDRERKRTQKHFVEANKNMQNYHRLFLASQDGYDRLTNLAGSGGAEGFKNTDGVDMSMRQSAALSLSSIQFGDISDEDSYPSSGSESRESSAGSVRSQLLPSNLASTRGSRTQRASAGDPRRRDLRDLAELGILELDIPGAAKTSRDSGLSSGDPSPSASQSPALHFRNGRGGLRHTMNRSYSTNETSPNAVAAGGAMLSHKLDKRSRSAAMLTISPNKLREITDPIQQMLHQLHKLIYITQLPPTLSPNQNRRIIEQYKRALFAPNSSSTNLKLEMKKLMQGSRDIIDLNLGNLENLKRNSAGSEVESPLDPDKPVPPSYDPDYKDVGITYEYMQTILEAALEESGYYKVETNAGRCNRNT